MRLAGGFHIGADAAIPQKIHRHTQDRLYHLGRCGPAFLETQHSCAFRRKLNGFAGARIHAAPWRDQRSVVVLPARSGQREHARAFGERGRRIRVGVDEDVAVIEGCQQPDTRRLQHAITEDITAHVADARHGERLAIDVGAEFPKMTLDGFPGTACGDAHLLMIVTLAAAGGECIAQPEPVFGGDLVRQIRERRRTLVCRHDEVGVVAVAPAHARGYMNLAVDDVVGDVEQPADEHPVATADLALDRVAITLGQALADKSAFRPVGNDDGVLDLLGLHQAQHLGAEVLAPVRPAQAAARDTSGAQVDALHAGCVHENLVARPGPGQLGQLCRIELQRDVFARETRVIVGKEIRAKGCANHIEVTAQDAVLIEAGHRLQAGGDARLGGVAQARALPLGHVGIEFRGKNFYQCRGQLRTCSQYFLHIGLAEGHPRLHQVLGTGAQQYDLAAIQPRDQHQPIMAVVFDLTVQGFAETLLEALAVLGGVEHAPILWHHIEVLDVDLRVGGHAHPVRTLAGHLQAHVFQNGYDTRQRQGLACTTDLQTHALIAKLRRAIQRRGHIGLAADDGMDTLDVEHRLAGLDVLAVGGGKDARIALEQLVPVRFVKAVQHALAQAVNPGGHGFGDTTLDFVVAVTRLCIR